MSKTISEQSLSNSRLKTIVSQQKTRHPTTIKKKNLHRPTQFEKNYYQSPLIQKIKKQKAFKKRANSLRQSLQLLQSRQQQCIERQNFKAAMQLNHSINRTKSLLNRTQLKRLKKEQVSENKSIKSAYNYQLKYFQQAWSRYFQQVKERQKRKMNAFQEQIQKLIEYTKIRIAKKCRSLNNKSADIIQLQKQQDYYKRKGDIVHLSQIKRQKKKIKAKLKRQRQSLVMKWTKDQQTLFNTYHLKKYEILVNRLKQQRKDQERVYFQQKNRMKQKYKNVMSQLKHQQRMVLNFANLRAEHVKIS